MIERAVIRHQLFVSLHGAWFKFALLVSLVLSFAAAFESIALLSQRLAFDSFYLSHRSAWANWMVVNAQGGAIPTVFFTIIPLLASVPYVWSFHSDRMSGYASQVISRSSRVSYLRAKMIAAFCSSALVAGAGLLANILVLLAALPANVPFYEDSIIIGVFTEDPFSSFFYNVPFAYMLLYTIIDMMLMGCWAMCALGLSAIFKNRVSVMVVPYLLLYGWHVFNTRIISFSNMLLPSLNIIDDLDAFHYMAITEPVCIVFQVLCMLACTYICYKALLRGDIR